MLSVHLCIVIKVCLLCFLSMLTAEAAIQFGELSSVFLSWQIQNQSKDQPNVTTYDIKLEMLESRCTEKNIWLSLYYRRFCPCVCVCVCEGWWMWLQTDVAGMELTLQTLSLSFSLCLLNIASCALKSIVSLRERVCLICVSLCLDVYVSRGGSCLWPPERGTLV